MTYLQFGITTKVSVKRNTSMIIPAVTICNYLKDEQKYPDELINWIDFDLKDVKHLLFRFNVSLSSSYHKCIKINGGINSTGHSVDLLKSKTAGVYDGLRISFIKNMPIKSKSKQALYYYVGDNYEHPTNSEIKSFFQLHDHTSYVGIKRIDSKKLGYPYNECLEDLTDFKDKSIINRILSKNITYRVSNCLQLCEEDFIAEKCNCTFYGYFQDDNRFDPADDCRGSVDKLNCVEPLSKSFDTKICEEKCPTECNSVTFTCFSQKYYFWGTIHPNFYYDDLISSHQILLNIPRRLSD